jgi:hypothetical protein
MQRPHPEDQPLGNDSPPEDEAVANAKLIAAAPHLLEALQLVQGLDIHPSILRIVDDAVKRATK